MCSATLARRFVTRAVRRCPPRGALHDRVIESCRTAALGGHLERCDDCGHQRVSFNSCRDRNRPKCQGLARAQWLEDRQSELLDVPYYHVVFTVPQEIEAIAFQNQTVVYDILFQAASDTLRKIAADPQHLGAEIGFPRLCCIHAGSALASSPSTCTTLVPGGGIAPDGESWIAPAGQDSFCRSRCCHQCFGDCSCTT